MHQIIAASGTSDNSEPNATLMDHLNKGDLQNYAERPGKQYLVFKNVTDFENALKALSANNQLSNSYRVAGQANTLEVMNTIEKDLLKGTVISSSQTTTEAKPSLMDHLNKGDLQNYAQRPGKQYIVFKNVTDFENALKALSANTQLSNSYRVAGQVNTLEVMNLIKKDTSTGRLTISLPTKENSSNEQVVRSSSCLSEDSSISSHQSSIIKLPSPRNILFCTDFDGTLTKREGEATVISTFYQSLLVAEAAPGLKLKSYKKLKLQNNIQELFQKKFGNPVDYSKPDSDMLMSSEAVAFFHEALNTKNVTVNIFTKNRADYIKALFVYQGFTPEELNKLIINDSGNKYEDLKSRLTDKKNTDLLYILDDSQEDHDNMYRAARDSNYGKAQIRSHNEKVGSFQWIKYLDEIRTTLAAAANQEPQINIKSDLEQNKDESITNLDQVNKQHISDASALTSEAASTSNKSPSPASSSSRLPKPTSDDPLRQTANSLAKKQSEIERIQTVLTEKLDRELKDFKIRRFGKEPGTNQDDLLKAHFQNSENFLEQQRYKVVEDLKKEIMLISTKTIIGLFKQTEDGWKNAYKQNLETAIENSLNNKALDKYGFFEKLGKTMLNCLFLVCFPLAIAKKILTKGKKENEAGSYFFSTTGKSKEAVEETKKIVENELSATTKIKNLSH